MSVVNSHWNICPYFRAASLKISFIWCEVSVGTLTALSVNRLLALLLELRYRRTSYHFKANLRDRFYLMGFACILFSYVVLASSYKGLIWHHLYNSVSYNPCLLLHKDFLHPPSSSKSSTRPCSTNQPNKSTDQSAIQKGSAQRNTAAIDNGRLLSSFWYILTGCMLGVDHLHPFTLLGFIQLL